VQVDELSLVFSLGYADIDDRTLTGRESSHTYASVGDVADDAKNRAGSDGDDGSADTKGESYTDDAKNRAGSDGDDGSADTKGESHAYASVGVVAGREGADGDEGNADTKVESHYYEPSISAVDTAPLAVPFECTTQASGCLVSATVATNDTCTDTDMMIDVTSVPSLAMKKYSFLRTGTDVGILSNASEVQTKRAVSSTQAPSSGSSSRAFSGDSHFSASTSSSSHAASTASSLPRQSTHIPRCISVANLLANAAEAIYQAYSAGAEPYDLAGHLDVVELCHQLAEPHLDDVTRKRAFERVAEIAHERVDNIAYVQKAQRTIIQLFKRFRTVHKQ
jgi:hypothetical protein